MSIMYVHTCLIGKIITRQWRRDVWNKIVLRFREVIDNEHGKSRFALLAFGTNREAQVAILTNTSVVSFSTKSLH